MRDLTHYMLDIETLGTAPNSYIAQIGIVRFDPFQPGQPLDHISATDRRFWPLGPGPEQGEVDARTAIWWMGQDEAARRAVTQPVAQVPLRLALDGLTTFLSKHPDDYLIWAKPPAFDMVILEAAYARCGTRAPWKYNAGRCVRTITDLAGMTKSALHKPEVAHHAHSDAVAQAADIRAAMQRLGLVPASHPAQADATPPQATKTTEEWR